MPYGDRVKCHQETPYGLILYNTAFLCEFTGSRARCQSETSLSRNIGWKNRLWWHMTQLIRQMPYTDVLVTSIQLLCIKNRTIANSVSVMVARTNGLIRTINVFFTRNFDSDVSDWHMALKPVNAYYRKRCFV